MAELARGRVADRPWGRTFATLGLRGVTGQLTLVAEGKRFLVAFDRGAVVAAASPLTADAAVRVALTNHLVSSSQVTEIARRLASAPERDEVDVIAEQARLGPDHALRLRRRVIAQRAARTFSITHGEFSVTDDTELTILEGCELDVRAVVYIGARANLSEDRLSAEVDLLGGWFRLKPGSDDDLPQFGFTDVEQPVVERLRDGGTLADIEGFATSFVDGRTVRAVVYALAACSACAIEPSPGLPRGRAATDRTPAPAEQPQPGARTVTQRLPRVASAPASPAAPTSPTSSTPDPGPSPSTPGASGPAGTPPQVHADAAPAPPVPSKTTTRVSTAPPPPRSGSLATGSTALRPPAEVFDAPTWRDPDDSRPISGDVPERDAGADRASAGAGAGAAGAAGGARAPASEVPSGVQGSRGAGERMRRPSGDLAPRENSNAALRLPVREALGLGTTSGSFHLPGDEPPVLRDSPSGPLRLPVDDPAWPDHPPPRVRRASEVVVRRDSSSGSLRLPGGDGAEAAGERARRSGAAVQQDSSSGVIRLPGEDELREGSSGVILLRPDDGSREGSSGVILLRPDDGSREGSSGVIRLPPDDALAAPDAARTGDRRRRPGSSTGLRMPLEAEAGPGVVVRRVTAPRAAPGRQVARVDTPASHSVKAVIAQRLKLLDQGADHFQLLGVTHDVAAEALRKAYFALARQLHPDRLAALGISDDGKHAQRLFAQINAGFAVLSDPGRRARYLDVLRRGGEAAVRAEQARAEELTRRILEAEEAFRRAELALRRDQPAAAIAELERAVELNPDEVDYRAALAWSRFCAAPERQVVAAATRTALEAAIQRAPRAVTARFYLGRVERMLGHDPAALRHFRDVLTVAPGHAEAAAEVRAIEARQTGGHGAPGRPRR